MTTLYLVAGPNGSGKTSFAESYFSRRRPRLSFVNPDVIAAGLAPLSPEEGAFRASRVMIARVRELIAAGESFAWR